MATRSQTQGLTLVELLVAISATIILLVAVVAFQQDVFSLSRALDASLTAQHDARQVLKTFASELRSASPSSTGAYPLGTVEPTSLIFYSDIDDDGLKERVRYELEGSVLKKGIIRPTGNPPVYLPANEEVSEVVHDVVAGTTTVFAYFDEGYDGTTAALAVPVTTTDVRLVQISFDIDSDPARPPSPLHFTSQVSIRNVKENL